MMIIIFTIGFGIDKWGNDCTIRDEVPFDHRPLVNAKKLRHAAALLVSRVCTICVNRWIVHRCSGGE